MRGPAKHLTKGVAIYGAGDAAIQIVNFLLLPVYVKGGFLVATDYGALALLLGIETFARIMSRWGLDGAFMRFYLDRAEGEPRQRMTSTLLWFLVAVDVPMFALALGVSGVAGTRVFHDPAYVTALRLMLVNTFLIGFTFIPFHVMRMRNQAAIYSAFAFGRSLGTLVLRIWLVIGLHQGVTGLYLADLIATAVILPALIPWFLPLIRRVFSRDELRALLRFGLPRVPHGLAQQALDGGNKILLKTYIPLGPLGVYQMGTSLGTGIKFFTSAFETAWAPFYYATAKQPNATEVFRKMVTYGVAVLALLVAGTTAVARDVVLLMLGSKYVQAATIVPLIAIGMGFQGLYLLTSIGLNLTSKTALYPVATFAAAGVGLGSGVFLMPAYGITGAAIAFLLSYITLATVAAVLAQRFYPVSYEAGRLVRVIVAAVVAALAAHWLVPPMRAGVGFLAHGTTTVVVDVGVLWVTGFFRTTELAFVREMIARLRSRGASRLPMSDVD